MPCPGSRRWFYPQTHDGRVVIDDPLFGPLANAKVRFELSDGTVVQAVTDAAGSVEAPASTGAGVVVLYDGDAPKRWFCALSPPPASTRAGLWQRLRNMGYEPPGLTAADAEAPPGDAALQMAVEEFQADHAIPVTGDADAETVAAVERAHDTDARPWRDRAWAAPPDAGARERGTKGERT